MGKQEKNNDFNVIIVNKKARFNYTILDTLEAGMVLTGNEIKSIREGGVSLAESYVKPIDGEIYLVNANIKEYAFSHNSKYDPARRRKLLLHKREIDKYSGRAEVMGLTLVPIRLYIKHGIAKLEIGLAKGKNAPDKRRSIMAREKDREAARAMKREY